MKNSTIFGLMVILGGALDLTTHSTVVRVVALVVVAGSAVLAGIALGSKPFKK